MYCNRFNLKRAKLIHWQFLWQISHFSPSSRPQKICLNNICKFCCKRAKISFNFGSFGGELPLRYRDLLPAPWRALSLTWMYWPRVHNSLKILWRHPARSFQLWMTMTEDPEHTLETTTCKTLLLKWESKFRPSCIILAIQIAKLQLHKFQAQKLETVWTVRCDRVLCAPIHEGQNSIYI